MARISSRPSTKPKSRGFTLGISMGSTNHAGHVLAGIVDWVNESAFEFGIIDLSDTLNRYGLMLDGMSENEARNAARKQGDQWLEDNSAALNNLRVPIKIIRWDEWLNDPRYSTTMKEIQNAIDTHPQLKMAIYADISNFYGRKGYSCTTENARLSMQYLVEEVTAHTLLHSEYDVTTIYPGKQLETYKLIRSGAVRDITSGIAHSPYIRLIPHDISAWDASAHQLEENALWQRKAQGRA